MPHRPELVPLVPGALVATVLLASCVASEQPEGPTFCDVAPIVSARCNSCHASVPAFGAPMPLAKAADFDAAAHSDPARPVWSLVQDRIHDATRPMPPKQLLTDPERATLDGWLASGRRTGGCTDVTPGAQLLGETGLDVLPCTPDLYVTASAAAHDGSAWNPDGFGVPPWEDHYKCFGVRIPRSAAREAVAITPLVDDARLVHHMILYLDPGNTKITPGPHRCDERSWSAKPLMLWGPGAGALILPGDVGLTVGEGDIQFELEVHYNNALRLEDVTDRSGFALCTSTEHRPITAQVATLGTLYFTIPAATDTAPGGLSLSNTCRPVLDEGAHVLATAPHMHALGKAMKTEVLHEDGSEDVLVDVENYLFSEQIAYPRDVRLRPGDRLRTTCRWENPHPYPVSYGARTDDEMCFNFLLYYPAGQLSMSDPLMADACINADEILDP